MRLDVMFLESRKKEGEGRAMVYGVFGTAKGEAAVVAVDDAGGDPEAETGSVKVFGGVEGFEQTGSDGGGHTMTGVGNGDADAAAPQGVFRRVACRIMGTHEKATTSLTHGIDGVGDEVVENLADVVFEAEDSGGGGVAGLNADAGVSQAALVEIQDGINEIGGGDVGGADGLAMETKGLSGDLADAREFGLRNLDVLTDAIRELSG